jgi:hypothetical protein
MSRGVYDIKRYATARHTVTQTYYGYASIRIYFGFKQYI